MKYKSYIDSTAYRIKGEGSYLRVNGWYLDDSGRQPEFYARINGAPAQLTLKRIPRPDAARRYARWKPAADCGFCVKVPVDPQNPPRSFELWAQSGEIQVKVTALSAQKLDSIANNGTMVCRVDAAQV